MRVVLHGTTPPRAFAIPFAKKTLEVTPAAGMVVGIERVSRREPGATVASDPILVFYAPEGELALAAGDAKETVSGPGSIHFDAKEGWSDADQKPAPSWVAEDKPTPYDLQIGEQFRKHFRPDRGVLMNLVEALDDDQKEVRRLAISATCASGGISYIVPLIHQAENPVTRRAGIAVLRDFLAEGPEAAAELHSELIDIYGQELGERLEKLLAGFTAKEAGDEATYKKLVDDLSSPEVAVRELAIDNLQTLTGRDDLSYDPDHAEGKGLRAWKDLLRTHELRSARTPEAAERTPAAVPAPEK
jgi:hypothetical protein